jgi:hypothetical protein
MVMRPVLLFSLAVVFNCPGASAAQVSGRDRDNILAACAQTHDTCLQSCNAAYPAGNIIREGDYRLCQDRCNSAYSSCIGSVNLKVGKPADQSTKPGGIVAPD